MFILEIAASFGQMVHVINEVSRRDLSNILLTKPFEQSPIGVLKTPPNGFEITDISLAFRDHIRVFGKALDRKIVEGELSFDCPLRLEQTQCIVFGNFACAYDRCFACPFDDVAFFVAIPNAAIPIPDCPELYISIRRDRSLSPKDRWTRQRSS